MAAPAAARAFAAGALARWGVDSEDAILVVGELASNALRHAATRFLLSIEHWDDIVGLRVSDAGPGVPLAKGPDAEGAGGRGLVIVETIAGAWGFHADTLGGKTVWADISLEEPASRGTRPSQ
jgi:anti-sigma regulatory factor (Ser/Thr protein kinase)